MTQFVRLTALIMALLLPVFKVSAFEPRGYKELSATYQQGDDLSLTLSAELSEWKELSAGSLPAFADWLKDASLRMVFSKAGHALLIDRLGEELLSLSETAREGKRLLTLEDLGFESPGEEDPFSLLLGEEGPDFGWLLQWPDASVLRDLPDKAIGGLAPYAREVKRSAAVKNLGTSPRRLEYKLEPEEWNSLWPALKKELACVFRELPLNVSDTLETLRFEKPVTVKRLLDQQGEPMGWQMASTVLLPSGVSRKLSFTGGYADNKGLYLNIKAPAVRGKDDLNLSLSAAFNERDVNADFSLVSRLGEERYSLKGSARLQLADTDSGERVYGGLWAEEKRGSESALRLTLEPDLVFAGGGARGKVRVLSERAGKTRLDVALNAVMEKGDATLPAAPARIYDLRAELPQAREALSQALLPLVKKVLMDFPEPARLLLLHDMGRTLRTEGEAVPAAERTPEFLVTEDAF